jgi:hypothetical protein
MLIIVVTSSDWAIAAARSFSRPRATMIARSSLSFYPATTA